MAKRALVIANSRYKDERFTALPAAAADADALTAVLSNPVIGDFSVEPMVDVGQRAATRAIESFFSSAKVEDLLVLHLSLHGWKDLHNRLFFISTDTERDFLQATAISAGFVSDCMSQSRSGRIIVLLDCCYSGAFSAGMLRRSAKPKVRVDEPFDGQGRIVITASTALQFAHESEPGVRLSRTHSQTSLFTQAVVQGLSDGSADLDHDGRISVRELYNYVHDEVRRKVQSQTPTLSVDKVQGDIYIARNPRFIGIYDHTQPASAGSLDRNRSRVGGGRVPRYRQIADDLSFRIESGAIARNAQLPTERELMEQYSASRNTIRDALKFLSVNGLVLTLPGQGAFVAPELRRYIATLTSDLCSITPNVHTGQQPSTEIMPEVIYARVEIQEAHKSVADALWLDVKSTVVSRQYHNYIDGNPWSLLTRFFPGELAYRAPRLIEAAVIEEGLLSYLEESDRITQVGRSETISVRSANETEALFFKLPIDRRVPVFEIKTVFFDQYDAPFMLGIEVYLTDRNQFRIDHGRIPELRPRSDWRDSTYNERDA